VSLFRSSRARPVPAPDPLPLPPLEGIPEAHIAVGSLSGIAPSDIRGHLLIVVRQDGRPNLSGTACPELAALILTEVMAGLARQAYAGHECGTGGDAA
jgi:hypothetical protein